MTLQVVSGNRACVSQAKPGVSCRNGAKQPKRNGRRSKNIQKKRKVPQPGVISQKGKKGLR